MEMVQLCNRRYARVLQLKTTKKKEKRKDGETVAGSERASHRQSSLLYLIQNEKKKNNESKSNGIGWRQIAKPRMNGKTIRKFNEVLACKTYGPDDERPL